MTCLIESTANAVYKHIKKLHSKSGRTKFKQYIAEGKRAVFDLVENGADVESVIICRGADFKPDFSGVKVYIMAEKLFEDLKLTVNSQGILAVVNYSVNFTSSADFSSFSNVLYLDEVTDPGNMGTILRSAAALGSDAIVLSKGCVDIFNPKVVRSSMASLMKIPIFEDDAWDQTFKNFENEGFQIIATLPAGELYCCDAEFSPRTVLVMGNEANGISDKIISKCTLGVKIPMPGETESLNVATATTVMLYEIMRSRYIKNKTE